MLDIKFIRQNQDLVKQAVKNKQVNLDLDKLLLADKIRLEVLRELEQKKHLLNKANIGKKPDKKTIKKLRELKQDIKNLESNLKSAQEKFRELMFLVPNIPFDDVPIGKDDENNKVIKQVGKKTKAKLDYFEIAKKFDLIDMKRAAKVSGSRFTYLKKELVLLEFALINFAFKTLVAEGFIPVIPPVMIKKDSMQKMGYWDRGKDEIYYFKKDDLCLVGTSEQPLGAMHMNESLTKNLPKRYVGFSTCFRREAGSYGKDTRGIFRLHQFDKVEMFSFCHPNKSQEEHEYLLSLEEKLMQGLELPYQVVNICTGDLGDPAAKKYDIETWIPSQKRYRETHSCSNCTDFQARRLNIKYAPHKFVHTLNGTAFSMRPLIAILENHQQKDGTIKIPKALQKYTGFGKIG